MRVNYSKRFLKNYKRRVKIFPNLHQQFLKRIELFKSDPKNSLLKDHQLTGSKSEYRAFSITGDIRVVYKIAEDEALFYDVGSHNQVY